MFRIIESAVVTVALLALLVSTSTQANDASSHVKSENKSVSGIAFPAIGQIYRADYGDKVYRVAFDTDGKTLRWAPFSAKDFEAAATMETYQVTYIRPGVFLVTWKEADGITVTHVEDFEKGIVHASITLPDHTFLNLKGSWTRLP